MSHVLLPKPGLLLVTTPFSLVRLLSCHCFLFLRMYHLVLDEADQLFARAPDQVTELCSDGLGCAGNSCSRGYTSA